MLPFKEVLVLMTWLPGLAVNDGQYYSRVCIVSLVKSDARGCFSILGVGHRRNRLGLCGRGTTVGWHVTAGV